QPINASSNSQFRGSAERRSCCQSLREGPKSISNGRREPGLDHSLLRAVSPAGGQWEWNPRPTDYRSVAVPCELYPSWCRRIRHSPVRGAPAEPRQRGVVNLGYRQASVISSSLSSINPLAGGVKRNWIKLLKFRRASS